ncbi:Small-conductance mechanosensitive channel [invertebrate metagenome]|uniref:Small-conductance mechanosensitive channel n=1 Tax=invertebrate metagenome TaxID=1711999 RepID=A0A2H9T9W6_9ZZZZ
MTTDILNQSSSWLANHESLIIQYVVNATAALLTFVIGYCLAIIISRTVVTILNKRKLDATISYFVGQLLKYVIIIMTIIATLGYLGVQTASFVALIGAAGLAIGLSLQGSLSNFASGLLLVLFRPVRKGELATINGILGTVDSIHLFSTILITPDNKMAVIPNASALSGNIINFSRTGSRRIDLEIGVSYQSDLKKTREVIIQVLETEDRILKNPAYTVGIIALADSSVNFVVRPWVKTPDYWSVYFDLTERIKLALDKAGIIIPFPQREVRIINENHP